GYQQHGQEVAHLPLPQVADATILGGSFVAAVKAKVVVPAILVVLAIGPVVLVVVADQIGQRETVVAGDEVNRMVRMPPPIAVYVEAAANALGDPCRGAGLAAHETPDIIAEQAIQLGPAAPSREFTKLR